LPNYATVVKTNNSANFSSDNTTNHAAIRCAYMPTIPATYGTAFVKTFSPVDWVSLYKSNF
jgi:hypothetical protein